MYMATSALRSSSSALVGGPPGSDEADADAGAREHLLAVDLELLPRARAATAPLRRRRPRESVTPSSRTANSSPPKRATVSVGPDGGGETACDLAEDAVAGRMAEAVVDGLELVEVDEHDGNRCSRPLGARERMLDAIREERPVGEVRDGVVEGLMGELILEHLALADVAAVQDDSADVLVREQVRVLDLELEPRPVAVLQRAVDHVSFDAFATDARDHLREAEAGRPRAAADRTACPSISSTLYPSTRSIDGL